MTHHFLGSQLATSLWWLKLSSIIRIVQNVKKCEENKKIQDIVLQVQPPLEPLIVNNQFTDSVQTANLLGVHLSSDLKRSYHIQQVCSKPSKRLYALRILKRSGVYATDLLYALFTAISSVLYWKTRATFSTLP